jgi:hypothetical protein
MDSNKDLHEWLTPFPPDGGLGVCFAPRGSGLTTSVRRLVAERGVEAIWISAATRQPRRLLCAGGTSCYSVTMHRKVIVIDEADAVLSGDCAQDVADHLKKRADFPCPILLLSCNTRVALARVMDVVTSSRRPFSKFVAACDDTDQRAASLDEAFGDSADLRDDGEGDGVNGACKILFGPVKPTSLESALRIHDMDGAVTSAALFENYALGTNVADASGFADACSTADMLEECMRGEQRWELGEYANATRVAAALVCIGPQCTRPVGTLKFGSVWSKSHNLAAKAKAFRSFNRARRAKHLSCLSIEDVGTYRTLIMALVRAKRYVDIARGPAGGLNSTALLAAMRLWSGKYTLAVHGHVKKHLFP